MKSIIAPRTVGVFIPSYSGRVIAELAGSLVASGYMFGGVSFTNGVSHPSLVRNIVAEKFLRSSYEWFVGIDDDIAFTPEDFRILMEPTTTELKYDAAPTVLGASGLLIREGVKPEEVQIRADAIVCAEYSYKTPDCPPCRGGMGFVRIHRSVFETLQQLKHDDGAAKLWQFTKNGGIYTDYFPDGAALSYLVPGSPWTGEDHGFFILCSIAGIKPRIETRTRLHHVGTMAYPYFGGEDSAGAQ